MPICNICSTVAPDNVDICPSCEGKERQRALKWLLDNHLHASLDLANKRILACHFIRSERLIFKAAREVVNFDVRPLPGLDLVMDFQDMRQLPDASFDGILSIHVFNHLPDDVKALSEAKRVLRPGGFLLSTVGYTTVGPTQNAADTSAHYGKENLTKFGVGTYRIYGVTDYEALLGRYFATQTFDARDPWTDNTMKIFLSLK